MPRVVDADFRPEDGGERRPPPDDSRVEAAKDTILAWFARQEERLARVEGLALRANQCLDIIWSRMNGGSASGGPMIPAMNPQAVKKAAQAVRGFVDAWRTIFRPPT